MSNLLDKKQLIIMTEEQKDLQALSAKAAQTTSAEADENFDWDAYANDEVVSASEKEALVQKYSDTLSKVAEKEVVEGTVISMNKRGCC